jgi:hypothetical protein
VGVRGGAQTELLELQTLEVAEVGEVEQALVLEEVVVPAS